MNDKAILLVTCASTIHLARQLLETTRFNYPVVVAVNQAEMLGLTYDNAYSLERVQRYAAQIIPIEGNRWELGAIQYMLMFTNYDDWILIQDTIEVKDNDIFNRMFEHPNRSVSFGPFWECYLGRYRREVLTHIQIPICLTKFDSVYQEVMFHRQYNEVAKNIEQTEVLVMFSEWGNDNPKNTQDQKFGRRNLVLDNPYIIKRKSLEWSLPGDFKFTIRD